MWRSWREDERGLAYEFSPVLGGAGETAYFWWEVKQHLGVDF